MGSSTVSLQSVVDLMKTMGTMSVSQAAGGYSQLTWLSIATDVVNDLISQKFNWKWNQFKVPSFWTNSFQCDYATVNQKGIGWLESGMWTDINNTSLPKPRLAVQAVRDLQPTSWAASPPCKAAVKQNSVLEQGVWPGPGVIYHPLLGATQSPQNPPLNILDANGNILVLTHFGVTGTVPPLVPIDSEAGTTFPDGSVVWTVANPFAQGFRINDMPPMSGVVYQIDLIAQANPPSFLTLSQMIDPIPDDYANSFRNGVFAYCHKYANDPELKRSFPMVRQQWIQEIMEAIKQGDREFEDAGFVPSRSSIPNAWADGDYGPGNPYGSGRPGGN